MATLLANGAWMVGMGLGASKLKADVVVLAKTQTGLAPMDSFDVEVRGRAILPPLGPVVVGVHAAREPHEILSADGKKLGKHVAKKVNSGMKRQIAAKTSGPAQ